MTGAAGWGEEGNAILQDEGGRREIRRVGQGREGKARKGWGRSINYRDQVKKERDNM